MVPHLWLPFELELVVQPALAIGEESGPSQPQTTNAELGPPSSLGVFVRSQPPAPPGPDDRRQAAEAAAAPTAAGMSAPDTHQIDHSQIVVFPGGVGASQGMLLQSDVWARLFSFTTHLVEARFWTYSTHSIAAPNCFARCLSEDGLSADQRGFQRCKEDWELLTMAETMASRIEGSGPFCRQLFGRFLL